MLYEKGPFGSFFFAWAVQRIEILFMFVMSKFTHG